MGRFLVCLLSLFSLKATELPPKRLTPSDSSQTLDIRQGDEVSASDAPLSGIDKKKKSSMGKTKPDAPR